MKIIDVNPYISELKEGCRECRLANHFDGKSGECAYRCDYPGIIERLEKMEAYAPRVEANEAMGKKCINAEGVKVAMWHNFYRLEDEMEKHGLDAIARSNAQHGFGAALEAVVNYPPADVVEVVRCKDCLEAKEVAPGRYSCFMFAGTSDGNWYCADGKRKETKDE